mmetsp:Transcript_21925/g.60865  ORF Transcript_21925/g.60865 Transcript_21925/m.60865 type:complete len:450 (-) Transcript_21925:294-1643(-)
MTVSEDLSNGKASMLRPPTPRSGLKVPLLDLRKLLPATDDQPSRATPRHAPSEMSVTPRARSSPYRSTCSTTPRAVPASPRAWGTPRTAINPRTPRGSAGTAVTAAMPGGLKYEMDRLQSELTSAQKGLHQKETEVKTLLSKVRDSTAVMEKKSRECEKLQARVLDAEQRQATTMKEHETLKSSHMKLGSKLSSAERQLDQLTTRLANTPQGPNISIITKNLQSELTAARRENQELQANIRGKDNLIRAKDKELKQMATKVAETESLQNHLGESQNKCLYLSKQLDDLREDVRTVLHVQNVKDAEFKKLVTQVQRMEEQLTRKEDECNKLKSDLEMAHCDTASYEAELSVTMEKLHRSEQVAARVARFEQNDGVHGDGTVPFQFFANETGYLKGVIQRLRQKLLQVGIEDTESSQVESTYWAPESNALEESYEEEEEAIAMFSSSISVH